MARYKNTKIKKDKRRNVTVRSTTLYEEVPKRNDDIYVIAQDGDRLDNLAFQFYGNQHLWWYIARANHLNALNIPAGKRLRIPTLTDNAKGK